MDERREPEPLMGTRDGDEVYRNGPARIFRRSIEDPSNPMKEFTEDVHAIVNIVWTKPNEVRSFDPSFTPVIGVNASEFSIMDMFFISQSYLNIAVINCKIEIEACKKEMPDGPDKVRVLMMMGKLLIINENALDAFMARGIFDG